MKIFLSMISIAFIVASCDTSSELNSQNQKLEDFLSKVEEENKKDGPIISSASWISSNFITFDSQKVIADYGTRYTLNSLEKARKASSFDNIKTSSENNRNVEDPQKLICNASTIR
jgi:hypothetical protein